MILCDVNIFVHAFRPETQDHELYRVWLTDVVSGADELALVDTVLAGFVRVVTHPRIFDDPAPTGEALRFVAAVTGAARVAWPTPGPAVWQTLGELAAGDVGLRGNVVPDAYLAAIALTNNARVATRDRGFARFPGLVSFDPVR